LLSSASPRRSLFAAGEVSTRVSHRITEDWMGTPIETLADLLRPGLQAVCVGINPAPKSVAAGHYFQGRLGQQFYERMRTAGVLTRESGWEDDVAFAQGIGFTDIVKRPTVKASDVRPEEFAFGKPLLRRKLADVCPDLVIFTFKATATALFGAFEGNGFIERVFAGAEAFVMPGPYERRDIVASRLEELRRGYSRTRT
jgi:TDG/mug DNA glycosylase family protein